MLGASLLTSHASGDQMLSENQLTEHHNDPIFIMYKRQFWSAKSFTKTALRFREDLINMLNICSYINLSYILEITGKILTGLLLDLSSFSSFLKTGITSACFKQWGNSPLTRDWLEFWNINLEKMSSFIFVSFTGISPSGEALLVLRVLIISFTLSIETGWKLTEEIFLIS